MALLRSDSRPEAAAKASTADEILASTCGGLPARRGPSFLVIAHDLRENQPSMALRLAKQDYQDIERVIELDFVRATEAAALNSLRWLRGGYKEAAAGGACGASGRRVDLM